MLCDLICISWACWTWFIHLLGCLPLPLNPCLLKSTLLLFQGYSHHQAQVRTGLGKGTIGRISKEVEGNRENHPGGCPSKLSPHDTQSIISQITSGKFDNAVQAIQFIDSTLYTPVTPHTVRNVLKEAGLWSATKIEVPLLKGSHCQWCLKMKTGLWGTQKGCCRLMRQRQ